jgi:hypothetical protein
MLQCRAGLLLHVGSGRTINLVSQRHLFRAVFWQSDSCEHVWRNYFCMSTEPKQTPLSGEGFIDEKQLLARLPISRGTLGNWKAKGLLPYIKIGRRCLYDWASVQAALLCRQRGGLS